MLTPSCVILQGPVEKITLPHKLLCQWLTGCCLCLLLNQVSQAHKSGPVV